MNRSFVPNQYKQKSKDFKCLMGHKRRAEKNLDSLALSRHAKKRSTSVGTVIALYTSHNP